METKNLANGSKRENGNNGGGTNTSRVGTNTSRVDSNTSKVYNLIILDESGSMCGVTTHTIVGCNEVLKGIREVANEIKEQRQYVSIYCFDTENSRYLFKNQGIEEVSDLTTRDYNPGGGTPLYDAIGNTVSELKRIATGSDSVGKVTIITDGYENASRRWTLASVTKLIEELKKKGWIFTFIGANIDVEQTSISLGISSYLTFEQTEEGMNEMFSRERDSQRAYSRRMSYMRRSRAFENASEEEREEMLGTMNENYFTENERVSPAFIKRLEKNEIFVFGSNNNGFHDGGAALFAVKHFGAQMGQAEGPQGQSYAIPTVGTTFEKIKESIERFTEYAALHPRQRFMLTAVGCKNAGYTPSQIAPLFREAYEFGNVYVPQEFLPFVG